MVALVSMLLRHPRIVFFVPLVGFVTGVAFALASRPGWTAESRFRPQVGETASASRLTGLAAQFGISVAAARGESPDFYAEVLQSRELLRETVATRYTVRRGERTLNGDLIALLEVEGDSRADRVNEAVAVLANLSSVAIDPRSGILTLRTAAPWPELALDLNRRMVELVNAFNLQKRQSQARAEREFLEARLADAKLEVRQAEAELTGWLNENRRFDDSPILQAQFERLQRQVVSRQQVYSSLAQAFELARLDEVRNTPVITIVDTPEGSLKPKGRGLIRKSLAGVLAGGLLAAVIVFGLEYGRRQSREHPKEVAEMRRLWNSAVATITRRPRRRTVDTYAGIELTGKPSR